MKDFDYIFTTANSYDGYKEMIDTNLNTVNMDLDDLFSILSEDENFTYGMDTMWADENIYTEDGLLSPSEKVEIQKSRFYLFYNNKTKQSDKISYIILNKEYNSFRGYSYIREKYKDVKAFYVPPQKSRQKDKFIKYNFTTL